MSLAAGNNKSHDNKLSRLSSRRELQRLLAGVQGFEPQLTDPESAVLPLDDTPMRLLFYLLRGTSVKRILRVEDILCGVRAAYPIVNKTTVYRTLELLQQLGMVVVTDLGGGCLEYELLSRPHHHLICEKCHARIEVEDRFLEPLRASLLEH